MILLTASTPILLATRAADFRKGIDGLVAVCRGELEKDPRSGTYFVFINRSRTMIRVLVYDGTGYWLMTKRLSKGRFAGWPKSASAISGLDAKQLRVLISGHDPALLQRVA
jgi:transposase